MRRRRRIRVVLLLALGLAAMAVLGVWLGSSNSPNRKWKLPNGTEFTVVKVTHGKNHQAIDGEWRDMAYPLIPQWLRKKLNWQVGSYVPTSPDALVVWAKMEHWPRGVSFGNMFVPEMEIAAMDEDGLEAARASAHRFANGLFAFELKNYPHRSREITLRFYPDSREPSKGSGDFNIMNPARVRAARWVPDLLPASRETNGLKLTLLGIQTGWTDGAGWRSVQTREGWGGRYSSASFTLEENGVRAQNWKLASIRANALTGEQILPSAYAGRLGSNENTLFFQAALWREEPVWKLAVEAERTGNFPTQELWTVRGIPVPRAREVVEIHAVTNIHGVKVELLEIAGRDARKLAAFGYIGAPGYPWFRVSLTAPPWDVKLFLVGVHDDQGNDLDAELAVTVGTTHCFRVELPEPAKTLDITLAVSRSSTVEFLVRPELAK
jgi:hypothetical protein